MEWRPSIRVLDLDPSPLLEQQFPDGQVAVSTRNVELQENPNVNLKLELKFVPRILCCSPESLHFHPGRSGRLHSAPWPGYQPSSTPLLPLDSHRFAPV